MKYFGKFCAMRSSLLHKLWQFGGKINKESVRGEKTKSFGELKHRNCKDCERQRDEDIILLVQRNV